MIVNLNLYTTILIVVAFITIGTLPSSDGKRIPTEKLIQDYLLTNYSKHVKAEGSGGKRLLDVFFDMRIRKLEGLDIKTQVLSITAFTMLSWNDPLLQWDNGTFDGMKRVNLENTLVWTPDVVLYNTADIEPRAHTDLYGAKLMVDATGKVIWISPVTWKVSCQVDVTWFPVDKQICNVTFGSWSYNAQQIRLKFWNKPKSRANFFSTQFHITSGEWNIDNIEAVEENQRFICCKAPFSTITYTIYLTRMPLYYFIYILMPLLSQAFLFLIIFHIPSDSGERMGFGITILLNITMYLLVISEKLPQKSDNTPVLGICFIVLFYLLSFGLGISVVSVILTKKRSNPPNLLMRMLGKTGQLQFNNAFEENIQHVNVQSDGIGLKGKAAEPGRQASETSLADTQETLTTNQEELNNVQWIQFSRLMDKFLFYMFMVLVISLPIIICLSFDTTSLGKIY